MISANGGLPAHRYTPQVTPRWPQGFEPASQVRERAGRDVGGCAREGTPGREGGKREWTGATGAAAPTLVQAVAAGVAPTGQCGSKGGGGEKVCRQQAARYEALAHVERQRCRRQPPEQGPDTIYRLEMEPGRTGSGHQGGLEGSGGERGGQPSDGMRREVGQAEQSSAAADGHRGQREGEQEGGSQRSGHTGSAVQGKGAGQVEGGKGQQSEHGTQGKAARQEGLQGKGHGKAGLHRIGGKGHGATGPQGKGQGKEGGHGYTGSPVSQGRDSDGGEV